MIVYLVFRSIFGYNCHVFFYTCIYIYISLFIVVNVAPGR